MLAQLVEQRTFNPFVVGSTPAHPTKLTRHQLLNSKASMRRPLSLLAQNLLTLAQRWRFKSVSVYRQLGPRLASISEVVEFSNDLPSVSWIINICEKLKIFNCNHTFFNQ